MYFVELGIDYSSIFYSLALNYGHKALHYSALINCNVLPILIEARSDNDIVL